MTAADRDDAMTTGSPFVPDTSLPLIDVSIAEHLRHQAETFPDRPALIWDDGGVRTLDYRQLLAAVEALAVELAGLADPGDRIAVWSANSPQWVILECACALSATVVTGFNTAWSDAEVSHALDLTAPKALFVAEDNRGVDLRPRAARLAGARSHCQVIDLAGVETEAAPSGAARVLPRPGPDDAFLIQFTSGTTGRAKGAVLSHRTVLNAGYFRAVAVGADPTDVWVNPSPLHHMGGSVSMVFAAFSTGGCYVVLPRFSPAYQVDLMRRVGATRTGGVPTMLYALLEVPGFEEVLKSIRSVGLGGTSVAPSLVERLQSYGANVSISYGQSECPAVSNTPDWADAETAASTVGTITSHTELRLLGPDGSPVGPGRIGEVCVRSPFTMIGYHDMPEATAQTIDPEGFLHTGDLGSLDERGLLRIQGRVREMIIRGGENIYPIEVEDVLLRHPAVEAVAVIGTPSERWGEEVAAVVRPAPGLAVTAEELEAHAGSALAHFKVPRQWRFVESFPLTASGKIRKVELGALFG